MDQIKKRSWKRIVFSLKSILKLNYTWSHYITCSAELALVPTNKMNSVLTPRRLASGCREEAGSGPLRSDPSASTWCWCTLVLWFCFSEMKKPTCSEMRHNNHTFHPAGTTGSSKPDEYTHLLLLYAALQRLDVMLDCHVNEAVLGLGLHHSWALGPHHLDRLGHIDITVHSCAEKMVYYSSRPSFGSPVIWITALPFSLMISIKMSITIKVPVRPIPALVRSR